MDFSSGKKRCLPKPRLGSHTPVKDIKHFLENFSPAELSSFLYDMAMRKPSVRKALQQKCVNTPSKKRDAHLESLTKGFSKVPGKENQTSSLWNLSCQNIASTEALFTINDLSESLADLDRKVDGNNNFAESSKQLDLEFRGRALNPICNSINHIPESDKLDTVSTIENFIRSGKSIHELPIDKFEGQLAPAFQLLKNALISELETNEKNIRRLEEKVKSNENELRLQLIQLKEYDVEVENRKRINLELESKNQELRESFDRRLNELTTRRVPKCSSEMELKIKSAHKIIRRLKLRMA